MKLEINAANMMCLKFLFCLGMCLYVDGLLDVGDILWGERKGLKGLKGREERGDCGVVCMHNRYVEWRLCMIIDQ
jgi:hypothetical protein